MYAFYRLITIDKDLVGEDDADFAFLFSSTYDSLRTVGNGGNIENTAAGGVSGTLTVPADLVFSPNQDGSSKYDFEIEYYDPTTGLLMAWVQSGVSSAADTEVYLVYGDSGVVASQEDIPGTWDDDFLTVHHMTDDNGNIDDSTVNGIDGTKLGPGEPFEAPGVFNICQQYDGIDDYITLGDECDPGPANYTVEAWIRTLDTGGEFVGKGWGGDYSWGFNIAGGNLNFTTHTAAGAANLEVQRTSVGVNDNAWHYVMGSVDQAIPESKLYLDSGLEDTDNVVGGAPWNFDTAAHLRFGRRGDGWAPYIGDIDEVRISSILRTIEYGITVFNTMDDPTTFYGVGAEQEVTGGYGYYRLITIDKDLVGEDDANFAFLFNSTLDDLRTVGNGGHIENTDASGGVSGTLTVPADLVFSPNQDGSSKYDFEVQYYDPTTGELIAWVQSGVSSAADTLLYLVYGDLAVTDSQEDVNGTWDTPYKAVWHLVEEADGTPDEYKDSTVNVNEGEGKGGIPARAAGQIGYCQTFAGAETIEIPHSGTLDDGTNGPFTVEMWLNMDDLSPAWGGLFFKDNLGAPYRYGLAIDDLGATYRLAAYGGAWRYSSTARTYGAWYHVAFVYAGGTITFYVNGAADGSGGYAPQDTTTVVEIGDWAGSDYHINGEIDELRLSDTGKSSDYLTTVYNNGLSPETFYGVGDEEEPDAELDHGIFPRQLADGQLPNAAAALYTVPSNTTTYIRKIVLHNSDGATRTCTLWFVEASTGDTRVIAYVELAAGYTFYFETPLILDSGDAISGDDDSASSDVVDYSMYGATEV